MDRAQWTSSLEWRLVQARIAKDEQFRGCNPVEVFFAWRALAAQVMPADFDGAICQEKWDELLAKAMITFHNAHQCVEKLELLVDQEAFNPFLEIFLDFFCPEKWIIKYRS